MPAHIQYPRLRPVEAFPVRYQGKDYVGLRDLSNLAEGVHLLTQAGVAIAQHFDGSRSAADVAAQAGLGDEHITSLIQHLDQSLLLEGPTFEAFQRTLLDKFDEAPRLPVRAAFDVTVDRMDQALSAAETEELRWTDSQDQLVYSCCAADAAAMKSECADSRRVAGIVVPHLDLARGRLNYARGYRTLQHRSPPSRVIVFGTNHFGRATGVVACPGGYETAAGSLDADRPLLQELTQTLGHKLTEHRLDHAREHSIELQMPWIRHVLGDIPILGILVHDPLPAGTGHSYDGEGIGMDPFVAALQDALLTLGGDTLFVTSADLSHIGAQFGDDQPNGRHRLCEVRDHDRRHLEMLTKGNLELFLRSMTHLGNPTRWCTIGGLAVLWRMLPDCQARLLRYEQAVDEPTAGTCCVTSAAIVLTQAHAPPDDARGQVK